MFVNITNHMGAMSCHLRTKRHKSAEEAVSFISEISSYVKETMFKVDGFTHALSGHAFIYHLESTILSSSSKTIFLK